MKSTSLDGAQSTYVHDELLKTQETPTKKKSACESLKIRTSKNR
jgi:hypothetical protein